MAIQQQDRKAKAVDMNMVLELLKKDRSVSKSMQQYNNLFKTKIKIAVLGVAETFTTQVTSNLKKNKSFLEKYDKSLFGKIIRNHQG